jgi:serine phosphatase RsbU (regulator of sigma subunit)/CHASE3 domain sensor protein
MAMGAGSESTQRVFAGPTKPPEGRFSLRRRLQLLVVTLVAAIVGSGVIALLIIDARDDALDNIIFRYDPAAAAALRLDAALVDQQAAVSGFVLVQREDVLEPYERARLREAEALAELDERLAGTRLAAMVPRVELAIDEWRNDVVEPQLSSTRQGREAEARALATTGQELFDQARAQVRSLSAEIATDLRDEQRAFASARRAITETVAVNVIVATVLLIAVTVLLRRWVTDPLEDLRSQVAVVSGGDVRRAIRPSGPEELASVGEGVEAMRVRILDEVLEVRRAQEGLAQQAPAIVLLRDALVPRVEDLPESLEAAVHFEPAEGVLAGDWYEIARLPDGRAAVCLGDVAGHGATSAIVALRARDLVSTALRLGRSPGQALALVSEALDGGDGETFVTCFAAVVEPDGSLTYANGGHPPALLVFEGGVEELRPTGPLLGPVAGEWGNAKRPFTAGASLVVYTDGVIEANDHTGAEYGVDRLARVAAAAGPTSASLIHSFALDFRTFASDRSRDDVTVLAVTRRS